MSGSKNLHILLIHQAFVSLGEAGGTRHAEFAQHLISSGHRVTIIASPISYLTGRPRPEDNENDDPGLRVIRAKTISSLHRSFFLRLLNFFFFTLTSFIAGIKVPDVDVVWGTSPPIFQAFSAWLLARIKRVPFLLEIRDLWPDFAVAVGVLKSRPLIAASRYLETFLYKRADQLVVNSPGFVSHVKTRGGENITVIPNGADPQMFHPEDRGQSFRAKHNLKGKFVLLYAGAHGLSNDLETVLNAAKLLKNQPEIAIVLLGDGKDKPELIQFAQTLDLFNVHFLPPLPKSVMADALASSDACLAILKAIEMYKTVYPNKVFDYMAAGRPILLSVDGVIRNVVEEAGAGIFVPPGDPLALANALKELAANPKQAKQMGLAGRLFLEQNFDRAKLADQMRSLIEHSANLSAS